MRAFTRMLKANATNGAVYVLSASLGAVAVSNYLRPAPVSAQAGSKQRATMSGESRGVVNALQDAFVSLAEDVEPSVVTISARSSAQPQPRPQARPMQGPMGDMDLPEPFKDFFRRMPRGGEGDEDGSSPRGTSTGSGVIIRESGSTVFVLTNNHVVQGRDKIRIMLVDKTEYAAELVGTDVRTDLAVLKVKVREPLPANSVARLGNSDKVKVGQWAVAIGSPLGYDSTLTVGVVSAKGRSLNGLGRSREADYSDLIQTDASINPGNSGGALVNIDGEVIGINVAIASNGMSQGNIGIGFAIPMNTAKMVAEQLMSKGRVVRGYLGVACSDSNRVLSRELRDYLKVPQGGALAETVNADTPAAKAGMKDGDVIVKFGERDVRSFVDLNQAVAATSPGSTVPVEVVRDGKPVRLSLTVMERPSEEELLKRLGQADGPAPRETPQSEGVKTRLGFTVRPAQAAGGAEVATVPFDSPAFDAGLRAGDVILEVGGQKVTDPTSLNRALDADKEAAGVVLRVKTPAGVRLVVVRP